MLPDRKPDKALYRPPPLRTSTDSPRLSVMKSDEIRNTSCEEPPRNVSGDSESIQTLLKALSISGGSQDQEDVANKHGDAVTNGRSAVIPPAKGASLTGSREPAIDYKNFGHVLELYNFRKELNSADLQAELAGFEDSGFYLKWVDDTHCLAVFSSKSEADRALSQISGLLVEARQFKDASLESKLKLAKSPGDWAMPYKKRPPTNSSTAHRLILGHLSLRSTATKSPQELEKEKRDKEALQEARAQHERRKQAEKAIWDDERWDFP
ncbi:growth inhibition and differentiation-related protein 88 [Clonorchis sinensis]|uniref:Growth inhibition and differentiation-related protein 88 n=1 Tax=Clonorchis sinensis TaxID=79923 RepID=H2KUJ4_CLOSI|nr:growth inhibition and differentiation-related protein 88 [Clonorchis sinensis]